MGWTVPSSPSCSGFFLCKLDSIFSLCYGCQFSECACSDGALKHCVMPSITWTLLPSALCNPGSCCWLANSTKMGQIQAKIQSCHIQTTKEALPSGRTRSLIDRGSAADLCWAENQKCWAPAAPCELKQPMFARAQISQLLASDFGALK